MPASTWWATTSRSTRPAWWTTDRSSGAAVTACFEAATCFVMPSRMEPAGLVYLEAGAAGIASIGTTVGGAPELIGDGGRTVDPGDQQALERAMLELSDPAVAQRLGEAARRHSEYFTWRGTAERLLAALDDAAVDPL